MSLRLELYQPKELQKIVLRSAALLGTEIDPEGSHGNRIPQSRYPAACQPNAAAGSGTLPWMYHDGIIDREAANDA